MKTRNNSLWIVFTVSLALNAVLLTGLKQGYAQGSANADIQNIASQFATAFQNKDATQMQQHVEAVVWPQFQGLIAQPGSLGVVKSHSGSLVQLDSETAYFPVEWTKSNGLISLHFVTVKKRGANWKVVAFK